MCLRSSRRKMTMPGFSLRPLLLICLAPASLPRVLPAPRSTASTGLNALGKAGHRKAQARLYF